VPDKRSIHFPAIDGAKALALLYDQGKSGALELG